MSRMEFVTIRDFRTQTAQVWDRLAADQEVVITNNGRPRAFLVNIPEGGFEAMLAGIREARARIKPIPSSRTEYALARARFNREHTAEEMTASWQELKDMLAGIDGNSVDLKQARAERRAAKYERND